MVLARRQRLAIELGLVALVAWLAARGVSDGLRVAVEPPTVPPEPPAASAAGEPLAPLADYAVIAERDVFNPAGGAGPATARHGALRLWGVGLHGGESRAVIEDTAAHRQELYRVGDTVAGARLATIEWDRVTLVGPQGELVLALETPDTAPVAAGDAPAPPVRTAAAEERIRRTGEHAWIVDRRALTGAAENPSGLLTQLRAVAEVRDGRPAGFRLFQIHGDSLFARLGLRDGDVVRRVNGAEVAEPAALLAFLERLRTEPRVAVDIVRGDRPATLVYDLR
jgi:general secretion pathway protein C